VNFFIGTKTLAGDGINGASVTVKEVFRGALAAGASAIIIAHCHPSGNHLPSDGDIETTRTMGEAGTVLGVQLLDHFIAGCATNRTRSS
jgi:DNA repair protein RadC